MLSALYSVSGADDFFFLPRMRTRLNNKTTEKWPFIENLEQTSISFDILRYLT